MTELTKADDSNNPYHTSFRALEEKIAKESRDDLHNYKYNLLIKEFGMEPMMANKLLRHFRLEPWYSLQDE